MALPTPKNPLCLLLMSPLAMLCGAATAWGQFPISTQTSSANPANCQMIQESGKSVGDGVYTVYVQGGGTAQSVYCDMSTDGGGWTLVGRGREGWAWSESGASTSSVSSNVGTTSAFTPAYYASTTIDRMLKGVTMANLPDGVRLKRAANTTGTTWQEVRLKLTSQANWSWIMSNETSGLAASWASFNGVTYIGAGNTHDTYWSGADDNTRIFTWAWAGHNSQRGFSYGVSVNNGSNTASSYLWEYTNEDRAIPYTEVYVRPRYVGTLAYSVASGTAANQTAWTGSLGMDFNVGSSEITVVAVGYFAPGDAVPTSGTTITAAIYNRATTSQVSGTQLSFTSSSPGILLPGTAMRVGYLSTPVTLAANGLYSMVAQGYSATFGNGNSSVNFSTTNSRSGLISFVGTSRYLAGTAIAWPTLTDFTVSQYGAGTFLFVERRAKNCLDLYNAGVTTSGSYPIDPTGKNAMLAYCDMTTDGGGWTLILNYLHLGGTNPALTVRTNSLPIRNGTALGGNESTSTGIGGSWGHASSSLINSLSFTSVRFYCSTGGHSRILHFKTSHANTLSYLRTGTGSASGIETSYTTLTGHTANLPVGSNGFFPDQGNSAPTNFPFYVGGAYHWGISGGGTRWECDDMPGSAANNTFHQIYVK